MVPLPFSPALLSHVIVESAEKEKKNEIKKKIKTIKEVVKTDKQQNFSPVFFSIPPTSKEEGGGGGGNRKENLT